MFAARRGHPVRCRRLCARVSSFPIYCQGVPLARVMRKKQVLWVSKRKRGVGEVHSFYGSLLLSGNDRKALGLITALHLSLLRKCIKMRFGRVRGRELRYVLRPVGGTPALSIPFPPAPFLDFFFFSFTFSIFPLFCDSITPHSSSLCSSF